MRTQSRALADQPFVLTELTCMARYTLSVDHQCDKLGGSVVEPSLFRPDASTISSGMIEKRAEGGGEGRF